jgi:hypothetical protein
LKYSTEDNKQVAGPTREATFTTEIETYLKRRNDKYFDPFPIINAMLEKALAP